MDSTSLLPLSPSFYHHYAFSSSPRMSFCFFVLSSSLILPLVSSTTCSFSYSSCIFSTEYLCMRPDDTTPITGSIFRSVFIIRNAFSILSLLPNTERHSNGVYSPLYSSLTPRPLHKELLEKLPQFAETSSFSDLPFVECLALD